MCSCQCVNKTFVVSKSCCRLTLPELQGLLNAEKSETAALRVSQGQKISSHENRLKQ